MVDRGRSRGWGGRSAPSDDNARCLRNVNASQCICALAASDMGRTKYGNVTRGVTCFDSKEAALATGRIMQPRRGAAESWWWSALSSEMISMPHERVPLFEPAYVERIEAVRAKTVARWPLRVSDSLSDAHPTKRVWHCSPAHSAPYCVLRLSSSYRRGKISHWKYRF